MQTKLIAAFAAALSAGSVMATVITTEDFDTDTANWTPSTTEPITHVATGGAPGHSVGYISTEFSFSNGSPFGATIFRGEATSGASGGAFVGNYLTSGVNEISFYIRHDAGVDIDFNLRVATAGNSPGFGLIPTVAVSSDVWTLITLPVGLNEPFQQQSGTPAAVLPSVGNLQIGAASPFAAGTTEFLDTFTFDLDAVTISNVPEPSSAMLSVIGLAGLLVYRKRS